MNVLLSLLLWFALLTASCCGDAESHEEESTTAEYDYQTPTSDYDYNATFDYYYVTRWYHTEDHNKASGIGRCSPLLLLLGLAVHHFWI